MAGNTFEVRVRTQYLAEQSSPQKGIFRFAYMVSIRNCGDLPAQLVARHWWIEDAGGHVEQVRGLGVVGEQPLLQPDEVYEYTSGCQLRTGSGRMRGHYLCITEEGDWFECPVDAFAFDAGAAQTDRIDSFPAGTRVLH